MVLHGILRIFRKWLLIVHNNSLENLLIPSPARNCENVRAHKNSLENYEYPF